MLANLKIKNIALIEEVSIDFKNGFSVLTGETGAGKSIIIDALNFVLGERADKSLIRSNQSSSKVDAVFYLDNEDNIKNIFSSLGLEFEQPIILSRVMSISNQNECRVNGQIVTANMLRQISNALVDIHGQQEHQVILNVKNHLSILDNFCGDRILENKKNISSLLTKLKEINNKISSLGGSDEERKFKLEYIEYQLKELKGANLKLGEEEELTNKLKILNNLEKIKTSVSDCLNALDNSNLSVLSQLNNCEQYLNSISNLDNKYNDILERINSCKYELSDCADELKSYYNNLDFNQDEFNNLDSRLDLIKTLKRKFNKTEEELINYINELEDESYKLTSSHEIQKKLLKEKEDVLAKLKNECASLTDKRKLVAQDFENKLLSELKDLGMPSSNFKILFKDNNLEFENIVTSNGADDIEFMFSANLGEPLKPITKVISGGEASRFMLAFKNVISNVDNIPTLIFDEIDTGISGKIAHTVAKKMANISKSHQLICVTHLPQIAAMADNHFLINKFEKDNHTKTQITILTNESRIKEISRLLGAVDKSELSLKVAEELLKDCLEYKK